VGGRNIGIGTVCELGFVVYSVHCVVGRRHREGFVHNFRFSSTCHSYFVFTGLQVDSILPASESEESVTEPPDSHHVYCPAR